MSSCNLDAGNRGQDDGGTPSPSTSKRLRMMSPAPEPTSVLYNRSPSPPTSSSLASSSAPEPPPISADDWEAVLSGGSGDMAAARPHQSQDSSSFLRCIMDATDAQIDYAAFDDDPFLLVPPPLCQDHPAVIEPFLQQPLAVAEEDLEPRAVVDEVLEAARCADSGDTTGAREILTRLNHRLPSPPPPPGHAHPPLLRAAAHLRDALLRRLLPPAVSSPPSPKMMVDVALNKLAAHKALADASPAVQFASFTSTQAILDALPGGARRVHVFDLGVGFGDRWPPLMQELALQRPPPAIKLTALLVSPSHPKLAVEVELRLARDSLTRFAADLGIRFEFNAVVFDPSSSDNMTSVAAAPGEAVAVHLPLGLGSPPSPAILRFVRQLRPAVVVCVDDHGGCDLDAMAALLESLDAAGATADAVARIEHCILRPRLERLLLLAGGDTPPWQRQTMLASAGLSPVQLSAAAEAQAECLVSRTPTPGFNVVKRQAALALRWHQSELVTVSAWRCSINVRQL
ncbi:unnamed protein product [Urochloa humidicola]